MSRWFEHHFLIADTRQNLLNSILRGQITRSPGPPPKPDRRADGDIKCPFGPLGNLKSSTQDIPEIIADFDRVSPGHLTEVGQFAVIPIIAEPSVEFGDSGKRIAERNRCERLVGSVEYDPKLCPHVDLTLLESPKRGGGERLVIGTFRRTCE